MIRVQRIGLPPDLADRAAVLTDEIAETDPVDQSRRAEELWYHSTNRRNLVNHLRNLLQEMAHGNRCCMYCCSDLSTDIDHFEPRAINPLRTFDWLNHLLACTECNNNKGKKWKRFDDGEPMLIDPTCEDPFDHLYLSLASGEYEARTEKGDFTLDTCGLNRSDLPDARCLARDTVVVATATWLHGWKQGDEDILTVAARVIREQPFADVAQFMLRQAIQQNADKAFNFVCGPKTLEHLRHPSLRAALLAA